MNSESFIFEHLYFIILFKIVKENLLIFLFFSRILANEMRTAIKASRIQAILYPAYLTDLYQRMNCERSRLITMSARRSLT